MEKVNILNDVQDFIVLGKSENSKDNYVYAAKPSLNVMKQFYDESTSDANDRKIDAFMKYWEFDEKEGITGSSFFLNLRLDKKVLRPRGLWLPGLLEGKVLDSQGKLNTGIYRNFGIVCYNAEEPNREIAESLCSQAKNLGLETPLIVPFRTLDYNVKGKKIILSIIEPSKEIISSKAAQEKVEYFDYGGNNGVQRLLCGGGSLWDAGGVDLATSGDGGRVDWVCGKATQKILKDAHDSLMDNQYSNKIREMEKEKKAKHSEFVKSLKR